MEQSFELLELIANSPISKYVVPYVAGVYDSNDRDYIDTLSKDEYVKLNHEFMKRSEQYGFNVEYSAYYPYRIMANCGCDRINSMVIDAGGKIYKCWEEIGNEDCCIGEIGDDTVVTMKPSYYNYMIKDPTLDSECMNCKILPVCMSEGCPYHEKLNKQRECTANIKNVQEKLENSARKLGKEILHEIVI